MQIRPAAVAGMFYPGEQVELETKVLELLAQANHQQELKKPPKALVVPHAGYIYSGAVAAEAFIRLNTPFSMPFILLMGPSHRVPLHGMALSSAEFFSTPLGNVSLATAQRDELQEEGFAEINDSAHQLEHSLEVQLPFLQELVPEIPVLPVVVGYTSGEQVAQVISWGLSKGALVVISTDMSHFHSYEEARQIDGQTNERILHCATDITPEEACGCYALNGLLSYLRQAGLKPQEIRRCNSGDTAGDKSRVVGYAAYAVY